MPDILTGEEISSRLIKKVNASVNSGEQVQPAGYDVSVSKIFSYSEDQDFTLSIAKAKNSPLLEVEPSAGFYELKKGAYCVELNEITTIPGNAIGILFPRSTLLRNGLDLRTALFDPGYSGQPKVMLVCHKKARIERYARIGQIIILQSSGEFRKYSGQYQGERNTETFSNPVSEG